MIRTFFPFDVIAILFKGGSLSNKAITKDNILKKDTRFLTVVTLLGQWFNLQGRRRCLWVWSRGLEFRGLASVRNRTGANVWEVDRLLLDDDDEECCDLLLERLIIAGCESGVEKIFLRLPVDSPLVYSVKKAGFQPYVTEFLYGIKEIKYIPDIGVPSLTPRLKQEGDDFRVFELYQKCIPLFVRRIEGITFKEWQYSKENAKREWVFEHEGILIGWLHMMRSGDTGQFEVMTSSESDLKHIVSYTLISLKGYRRLQYLAREFQGELLRTLQNQGLDEMERYSVFIKELTVKTKDPCLVPIGA